MMPAKRTAGSIIAAGTFAAFNAFSRALLMQVPQLLIAETASDHGSKSLLSTLGLAMMFIRYRSALPRPASIAVKKSNK
jgi:hypothetical protein